MPYADPIKARESARKRSKKYRDANPEKVLASVRSWQIRNPEKVREIDRKRQIRCRERRLQQIKERRRKNPEQARAIQQRYKEKNPEKFRELRRLSQARMLKNNIGYKLKSALRKRLVSAIQRKRIKKKGCSISAALGCSIENFKIYLESRWEPGMSWDNYGKGKGKWQIDHEIPCAIFDLSKPNHVRRCFHFSNLQPMWSHENNAKGAKVLTNQFSLL